MALCPMTFASPCSDVEEECRGERCAWYLQTKIDDCDVRGCAMCYAALGALGSGDKRSMSFEMPRSD